MGTLLLWGLPHLPSQLPYRWNHPPILSLTIGGRFFKGSLIAIAIFFHFPSSPVEILLEEEEKRKEEEFVAALVILWI